MNPERKIDPSKIHLVSLKTLKGNIDSTSELLDPEIKDYKFDFTLETGLNTDVKMVGLKLAVGISTIGKDDELLGITGSYTHEIIFQVENLDDFLELIEGQPPVMDALMNATLTGIAFSTVRGIIYSRTIGTSLKAVIIPVIDPKTIIADVTGMEVEEKVTIKSNKFSSKHEKLT